MSEISIPLRLPTRDPIAEWEMERALERAITMGMADLEDRARACPIPPPHGGPSVPSSAATEEV